MPPGELRDPAARDGLPVARSTSLDASTCLSNAALWQSRLLPSNSCAGSSICACPPPVDPSLPCLVGWLPAAEHSLQKQESDSAGSSGRANGEQCDSAAAHRSIYAFGKLAPGPIRFLRNQRLTVTNKMLVVPSSNITLSKITLNNVSEFPVSSTG